MRKDDVMNNEVVSVIIPVFQSEKYLLHCVKSVLKQTYKEVEIILLDDGSNDGSLGICEELAARDARIKVFHHDNIGVAATRNRGLDCATGQFIYFLDSDDWLNADALSVMVLSLKNSGADLCICGFIDCFERKSDKIHYIGADGYMDKGLFQKDYFWKLYEESIIFNIGTKMYKRSIIEENRLRFHTDMDVYEDIMFCLEYIDKAKGCFICSNSYYYYFHGNINSITHSYKKDFWKNTVAYCDLLLLKYNDGSVSLKKAVLICLYRAYLQECHNPQMKKKEFMQILKEKCFPIARNLDLNGSRVLEMSLDQKIFSKLISWEALGILWILAELVSLKNRCKGRKLC